MSGAGGVSPGQRGTLEERLTRLEEIETARGVFQVYAATLDVPDAEAVAALFVEDAVLVTPAGTFRGRDRISDFYASAFAADPSVKRHFIVNPQVTGYVPGRVSLASHFLFVGRGTTSIIGWGTYRDVVDVTSGAPLFLEKTIDVHVGTDLSVGWAIDAP